MDFVQIMKDWRRMCKTYTTDDDSCCEGCPVVDFREHGCGAIFEMEDSTDWQRYADKIMAWAAEHLEKHYPTWGEYLGDGIKNNTNTLAAVMRLCQEIPADTAQKLGIEPKEG